jgi:NAD(P)-dependent dehydrogenase (short-subunit alcohol dehydrogenase family)
VLAHARPIDVGVAATINAAPPAGVVGVGGIAGAREALHSSLTFVDLDVTNDNSVSNGVQRVIERYGRIDMLVNNAGMGSAGAAEETSLAEDQRVFDINVFGVTRMTKAVLPHMRAQGAGRIIKISSILGLIPQPYVAAYSASKHPVEWYSESVDHEVHDHGIRFLVQRPNADRALAEAFKVGDEPGVVAKATVAAATDHNCKLRYTPGSRAGRISAARRFAPPALSTSRSASSNTSPGKRSRSLRRACASTTPHLRRNRVPHKACGSDSLLSTKSRMVLTTKSGSSTMGTCPTPGRNLSSAAGTARSIGTP